MTPDDTTLSAYLAGDLDEVTSRRVDAALRDDPDLGRRLDEIADVLWALRTPAEGEVPDGLDTRLAAHLAEAGADPGAAPATARRAVTRRWAWTGSAAAGLVAAAVLGVGALSMSGEDADHADLAAPHAGGADATLESAEAPTTMEVPSAEEDQAVMDSSAAADADAAQEGSVEGESAEDLTRALGFGGPVVSGEVADIPDEGDLAGRYADAAELDGLLGLEVETAAEVADGYRRLLEASEPLPDGTPAARCVDDATADLPWPHVVARVELVQLRGVPAVAHLVAVASGAGVLDRSEVRVTAVPDCTLLTAVALP